MGHSGESYAARQQLAQKTLCMLIATFWPKPAGVAQATFEVSTGRNRRSDDEQAAYKGFPLERRLPPTTTGRPGQD